MFPPHIRKRDVSNLFISDRLTQGCREGPDLFFPVALLYTGYTLAGEDTKKSSLSIDHCRWKLTCVSDYCCSTIRVFKCCNKVNEMSIIHEGFM